MSRQRLHYELGLRPTPEGVNDRGKGPQGLRPVLCCGQRACQTLHLSLVLSTAAFGQVFIVNFVERVCDDLTFARCCGAESAVLCMCEAVIRMS